jgi:hypothetical protein
MKYMRKACLEIVVSGSELRWVTYLKIFFRFTSISHFLLQLWRLSRHFWRPNFDLDTSNVWLDHLRKEKTALFCSVLFCSVLFCSVLFRSVRQCKWIWVVVFKQGRYFININIKKKGAYYTSLTYTFRVSEKIGSDFVLFDSTFRVRIKSLCISFLTLSEYVDLLFFNFLAALIIYYSEIGSSSELFVCFFSRVLSVCKILILNRAYCVFCVQIFKMI